MTPSSRHLLPWYALIADEATDVANHEQLNLSIRWVSDDYEISEDPVGLYVLPNTKAETLYFVHRHQLLLCAEVIKQALPMVKKVTSVHTLCEAMNTNSTYKSMLSEVHKSLRLYLTIPITSATSERTFSALRRVLTYLRSTMTEQWLNQPLFPFTHAQAHN